MREDVDPLLIGLCLQDMRTLGRHQHIVHEDMDLRRIYRRLQGDSMTTTIGTHEQLPPVPAHRTMIEICTTLDRRNSQRKMLQGIRLGTVGHDASIG